MARELYLAERKGVMDFTLIDGAHSDEEGVATAAKLHRRIFNRARDFVMIEVHPLPDLDPPINESAAAACADALAKSSVRDDG
jgi:hypothetical protein